MTMKKKILTTLSVVLILGMAAMGILAYLTSTDSDVNVMTLGNVQIEQHEYQRADGIPHNAGEAGKGNGIKEGDLVPFEQNQGLYPAVPSGELPYTAEPTDLFFWGDYVYSGTAANGLWNDAKLANVMDKMVFVENTGKSDCYYRTIIAFECPEGMEYSQGADKEFMMNVNGSTLYNWEEIGYITIGGVRYHTMAATYQNALKPGQTAHPSLLQVVMTHNATNEDMELLGDTYEILVLSQAVQAEGFANAQTALDTAFGDITVDNHPWKEAVVADTAEEVVNGLEAGKDVTLVKDINLGTNQIDIPASAKSTLDLNGFDIVGTHASADHYAMFTVPNGADFTVEGKGEVKATTAAEENNRSLAIFLNAGKLTINGGTYNINDQTTGKTWIIATIVDNRTNSASCNATLEINGGDFYVSGNAKNLFRNYPQQGGSATLIVNDGVFHANNGATTYFWNQEANSYPGEMYFNGGIYDATVVYEDYNGQADIHIAPGVGIKAYSGNN